MARQNNNENFKKMAAKVGDVQGRVKWGRVQRPVRVVSEQQRGIHADPAGQCYEENT